MTSLTIKSRFECAPSPAVSCSLYHDPAHRSRVLFFLCSFFVLAAPWVGIRETSPALRALIARCVAWYYFMFLVVCFRACLVSWCPSGSGIHEKGDKRAKR